MKKVIKTCGHCYNGMGWIDCDFWVKGDTDHTHRCKLFGNTEKWTSESLLVCNSIYGRHYEGKP